VAAHCNWIRRFLDREYITFNNNSLSLVYDRTRTAYIDLQISVATVNLELTCHLIRHDSAIIQGAEQTSLHMRSKGGSQILFSCHKFVLLNFAHGGKITVTALQKQKMCSYKLILKLYPINFINQHYFLIH
jgi:hypothetical protein